MAADLVSLTVIALIAALCPIVANLIPRQLVPETVMLLLAGTLLGPHGANVIALTDSVSLLSDLGLAFLFLLAGYEINPKNLVGKQGKRGLVTWIISFATAYLILTSTLVFPQHLAHLEVVALNIAVTTTALGALLPILKERGLSGTRLGNLVLAYGTWGELCPVLAMALLLSTRAEWKTVAILFAFALLCVVVAVIPSRAKRAGSKLYGFLTERADTTSQTMMRLCVFLLIGLIAFSAVFDLDIVLGAFAAGFILRYIVPEGNHSLENKIDGIAYGFLIPLFFITSGAKIDLAAVAQHPLLLVVFIAALFIFRCLPIFIALSTGKDTRDLSRPHRATVSLYCTTALPLIVAVTSVAVNAEVMSSGTASVLVAAGAITVFLMPLLTSLTYRAGDDAESIQEGCAGEPNADATSQK